MKTETLIQLVQERGLKIEIGTDDSATLRGPKDALTPKLLRVLKLPVHKQAIIERFKPVPLPLCIDWKLTFGILTTLPHKDKSVPLGATAWRMAADATKGHWRQLSELPGTWGLRLFEEPNRATNDPR